MRWSEARGDRTEPEPRDPVTFAPASVGVHDTRVIIRHRWHKYPVESRTYIAERLQIELRHDPATEVAGREIRGHGNGAPDPV